ncbi:MAG: response regulator [Planctomycetales bacterium]|nr:response regulator [Planctomycetales bacterium]
MNAPKDFREVEVLLVEDDDVDAEATLRAFRKARIANAVYRVRDGVEGLAVLRGTGAIAIKRPFLVLLDLNLPRMDGIDFLREVRSDPSLADTLVFVLTTSDDERDKNAAYERQVAGYIVKSRAGRDFAELTELLDHYWRVVEFPPERPQ